MTTRWAPPSKSATQRMLLLAALADGESVLRNPLDCDDSRSLAMALAALGVDVEVQQGATPAWTVRGGSLAHPAAPLHCGSAGTCLRFLAALTLLLDGPVTLDAGEQLRRRPLADVVAALRALGRRVACLGAEGGTPVRITPGGALPQLIELQTGRTSQLLSGLLMVAPLLGGLTIRFDGGELVSRPYVELTLALMRRFGVHGVREEGGAMIVPAGCYHPVDLPVEGDWSAGAMLLVGSWLLGRRLPPDDLGLDPQSVQGDRAIVAFLDELDRPRPHRFDLSTCPDLITPLAVACAFAGQPSEIVRVAHARLKESDRIGASVGMLAALGVRVEERPDGLRIEPGDALHPALVDDRGDHRVAMAAGLLSLRVAGVRSADPACVAKSWPEFWRDLEMLRSIGQPVPALMNDSSANGRSLNGDSAAWRPPRNDSVG